MPARPSGPPPPPTVQRLRVRYAKRGPLRFTSHRDLARVLERGLRRARVPMAFSAGFSPHPKISYIGACPTGVASEAEYAEIGLSAAREPAEVRRELDAALPPGVDVLEVVAVVPGEPSLADRIDTSRWVVELPGMGTEEVASAVSAFLAAPEVTVSRKTKDGSRLLDARAAVVHLALVASADDDTPAVLASEQGRCATLELVVRHSTPAVRPDDVLAGLRLVAGLAPASPPRVTRSAQGRLRADGSLDDPLAPPALARVGQQPGDVDPGAPHG